MDIKKINKKGNTTVTSIVLAILVIIGVFITFFGFFSEQMDNNDSQLDPQYNETYTRLDSIQTEMDTAVNNVKNNLGEIKEADEDFQSAWNGFKALGSTLLLPIQFVSPAVETVNVVTDSVKFIPSNIQTLLIIAIITVLIFIILGALSGGNPKL